MCENEYKCAPESLLVFCAAHLPKTIMKYRELALINAIKIVLPGVAHIPCILHIQTNVLVNCEMFLGMTKTGPDF